DDHTDKVSFTRTVSKNEVTGEIAYGDWKADKNDSQFDFVKNPELKGYRPDSSEVGKQTITPETKDMEFKVTYTPLIHSNTESKEVTETIHYVDKAGNKLADDHTDKVSFTRTVSKNEVTGEIAYGDWVAENNDSQFDRVESPKIKGYEPDKNEVGNQEVTAETGDIDIVITYYKIKNESPAGNEIPKISEPPVTKYQENINENDTINSQSTNTKNSEPSLAMQNHLTKIQENKKALPKTGDDSSNIISILGVVLTSVIGLIGVNNKKRKHEK
ncbi:MAG: LPXTG cell wall anchor domain-containing protein, partial [Enterococcus sp.]|uniref:mucin-binding protein n=1 Tax=Enterococcus sp. TaxID=35783 RepID=UPI002FC65E74